MKTYNLKNDFLFLHLKKNSKDFLKHWFIQFNNLFSEDINGLKKKNPYNFYMDTIYFRMKLKTLKF